MTKWILGLCTTAAIAVAPTDNVFAMQYRVYTCQSAYDNCLQWFSDRNMDATEALSNCGKKLSDALSSGDDTRGYWRLSVKSDVTMMCSK